ncbi:hypothetical protein QR721_12780 [Aciduricibacillus chroicocephali]|uniref:DUF2524 domain-containing protein n=1 Tax=Aciduricibacillus chroicocephali TaxID=3054939 RepID=A0ABY9KVA1_9BACI|nr:hypothetical protein QR721_12780 [Bacillaceae bacterium 44XB]
MEYQKLVVEMNKINEEIEEQPQVDCCSLSKERKSEIMHNLKALESKQKRILKEHGLLNPIKI